MTKDSHTLPDIPALERLVHKAVQALPAVFRDRLGDVVFRVQDFADSDMLRSVGLSNPWELLGLYHGRPIGEHSIWETGDLPSVIALFRCPLLHEQQRRGVSVEEMVTHVIVHEVGHHFGLSDAEMHAIEDDD
ncbi:MAG: metallopeptidase family protein [Sphingomonadales bacterium]|nr:metallopeptidase family protein [Sphingomonadales bacterium]MDE2170924.1 metallopeptidase family protein [Sphingomonadales bacterium]